MPQLSLATLPQIGVSVGRPNYTVGTVEVGVVHLGPGAFHRAHQAAYFDALLAHDPRWGICGISLRSKSVEEALAPQDGLYTLALLEEEPSFQVIGSIRELITAPDRYSDVMARLNAPATKLVTLTVTEFGYSIGADGHLDTSLPVIQHDIANPQVPKSVPGILVEALRRRRDMGFKPFTVLSCDNLASNGKKLKQMVVEMAMKSNWDLAQWISHEVPFPCSMVDSITPATTDALRAQVASVTGVNDAWPIQREGFTQWVIEPDFIERPALDEVGVVFSNDVEAFERAKLRLLNGSHSTLAYMGLHLGLETVFEAVTDPALGNFARAMMLEEILPGLTLPKELDGYAYSESLLARYRNKAIRHELAQIAWDGSQKLPIRILATVEENLASGRPVGRLTAAVAAWLHFVLEKARAGEGFKDPHAEKLAALALKTLSAGEADILGFVRGSGVFSDRLLEDAGFLNLLALQFNRLKGTGDGSAVDLSTLMAAA